MKILFIPTSYPDKSNTTRNVFIQEQAVALAKNGHDVRVLHAKKMPTKSLFNKVDKTVMINNDPYLIRFTLPVKTIVEDRINTLNKALFVNAVKSLYYSATKDGWKPDVIYAHFSCWAGLAAIEIGSIECVPVIVMEHYSGFMNKHISRSKIRGLKKVVNKADAFICVSENLKTSVINKTHTNRNLYVVPNMIDPCFVYNNHILGDTFIFSSVCNLNKRKRVYELVDAFCEAFTKEQKVKLLIGGDGPEKNHIMDLIKANEREEQIIMLGRLNREDTLSLYNQSNCFALASAHETFGIVWREAMATGLPVITSNHEGWSEQDWSDQFGIMVPIDDKQQLVMALKAMLSNSHRYNGKYISDYCQLHYSDMAFINKLNTILNSVVG